MDSLDQEKAETNANSKYMKRKRRFEELDAQDELISQKKTAINQIREHQHTKGPGNVTAEISNDEAFLNLERHGHSREHFNVQSVSSNFDEDTEPIATLTTISENYENKPGIGAVVPEQDQGEDNREDSGKETNQSPSPLNIVSWVIASLLSIQLSHNLSDACFTKFLLLLSQIFSVLSPFSNICKLCANLLPRTLYSARKLLSIDSDNFKKYVVCPNCCALYDFSSVVREVNGILLAKKCDNQVYSCRSADRLNRKKGKVNCDSTLVEKVTMKDGKVTYAPLKVYCFNSVIERLEKLLQRPNFIEKCNQWRNRHMLPHLYSDIYDGNIWKNFVNFANSGFLNRSHDFGCMINVDWYQPFSRRSDKSLGAIYLVFLNLPREERFKKENCVLVGILPPLSKEPESLASFLEPLVTELKALWTGIPVLLPGSSDPVTVRMALMCAAADIPAARKLCGYLGHGAIQGCSHCSKPMWNKDGRDCGLPDVNKWPLRSREDHLKWAKKAEGAETLTRKKDVEKQQGYRFTPLLRLPYFNPSIMTAIDPMHNLFLGTAKKMFGYWVEQEIITKRNLNAISARIQCVKVPCNIGRIPTNIASNFGQMTAKEWKNWVLLYSLFCLNGTLDTIHLRVWQTFVLACRHFCQPVISMTNLEIGSRLMRKFCVEVTRLYGKEFITPNMHLHCHLKESVTNFGSVYGFWLFSFERYNGLLSDMPTNKKDLPVQLMRKFNMFSLFNSDSVNKEFQNKYVTLNEMSSKRTVDICPLELFCASTSEISEIEESVWGDLSLLKLSATELFVTLTSEELERLQAVYSLLYKKNIPHEALSGVAQKVSAIHWNNTSLVGESNTVHSNGIVCASWADNNTKISTSSPLRPARLKNFVIHSIQISTSSSPIKHVFACVDWFVPSDKQFGYLNPVSVWSWKIQNDGPATFLPVQRIESKCSWIEEVHNMQKYLVTCPVPRAAYL